MYPIKIKKEKRKIIIKEVLLKIIDDSKTFIFSLKSPVHFIRFIRKSFYF